LLLHPSSPTTSSRRCAGGKVAERLPQSRRQRAA
jgi:hypothetical protein